MRLIALALTLLTAAFAQQQGAGSASQGASLQVTNPAQENAAKAKAILEKAIAALGGQAYLLFEDMRQQGRGFGFYRGASGIGVPYTRLYRYPDKERFEYFKDGDWVLIHNGDKGYETTFRGTKEEDPKDLKEFVRRRQYSLEVVLRDWAPAKETAFFYDGSTIAETKTVHAITLVNSKNQNVTLYIDQKTNLPIKKSYTWRDPETREMSEEAELYDSYRLIQGINTPHLVTRTKNGEMSAQRFLTTVAYNVGSTDALFTPPATIAKTK